MTTTISTNIPSNKRAPRFIISGAPASGKGTQCEFIKKEFNVVHLSTGDMLRAAAEAGTPIGIEAKGYMDRGALVPDETIIGVVMERLKQSDCIERGWLLDGFPRTRGQADALEKAGIECDVFIQLDVDDNLLVERVVGRRMDPVTGKIYHLKYSPPPTEDTEILERLVHRSDDTEEKVVVRIQNYKNNLDSIVDKYSASMIRINGNRSPTEAWMDIHKQIQEKFDEQERIRSDRRAPRFIISGAPASGKGTQCEFIKKEFNVIHLSTGDMLRAAAEAGTPIGIEAKGYMDRGALVPDETIIGVVMERLKQSDCIERGWLLDGFPRTRGQADALEKAGIECDVFIQLDVDDNLLVERVVGRRMDPVTGKIYHLKYSPPPADIISRLIHRSDDTEEKVVVRIQNYKNNLDSIVEKYSDRIIRVDGNRVAQNIWTEIRSRSLRVLKFHVVFILGGPGSGKGTLCEKVSKEFNYTHLSAGDLLREEMKRGGEYAALIQSITLKGGLVPAELTVKLLSNAMTKAWLTNRQNQFLIDGFPRNIDNTTAWFQSMSTKAIIDMVITLDCTEEAMKERILNRSKTSGRSDDNEETLLKRFVTFRNDTEPVLKSFDRLGKLRHIDASYTPDIVFKQAKVLFKSIEILPSYQRTFAMILPDSVTFNHVPEILKTITTNNSNNINIITKKLVTFDRHAVEAIFQKNTRPEIYSRLLQHMQSGPALILILEGTDVIQTWNDLMGPNNPMDAKKSHPNSLRAIYGTDEIRNSVYGSSNEEETMIAIDYWFDPVALTHRSSNQPQTDSNNSSTVNTKVVVGSSNISYGGLPLEDTYAMIKPLSAQINYDDIIAIIVGHGFEIVSELKTKLPIAVAHQFYNEHVGKSFFENLTSYMSSASIVGLHLRRPAAITAWRQLIGPTNAIKARSERYDSIRAKFGFDGTRNAVHGSDSFSSAARELGFFFSIGTFHSAPIALATPSNHPKDSISSIVDGGLCKNNVGYHPGASTLSPIPPLSSPQLQQHLQQHQSKKVHTIPSISRNDIAKMESFANEELNPIMTSLLRNLMVSRPKDGIEDMAISKLTDIKFQRMMNNGSVSLDSIASIQEAAKLSEELKNGSSLEEDSTTTV